MKNNKKLIKIFDYIIICLFIFFVIGLYLRIKIKRNEIDLQNQIKNFRYIKTLTVSPKKISNSNSLKTVKIDLIGPWQCYFNEKDTSISAFIKDNNIYVIIKNKQEETKFLGNADCLYIWKGNKGEKFCQIKEYKKIFDLFNLEKVDFYSQLLPILGMIGYKNYSNKNDFNKIFLKTCQKKELPKNILFLPPKDVIFYKK